MMKRRVLPALLLLALPGCTVGPDYHGPPATPVPAQFKNARGSEMGKWKVAEPKDGEDRADWWSAFHDPSLDALEKQATASNQDLAVAVARIAEARAQTRVAAADFLPSIQGQPSYTRERNSNTLPSQLGELVGKTPFSTPGVAGGGSPLILATQPLSRTYNQFSFPFDLDWEIDLFGRVRRNTEAARANAAALQADYQNTLLSVTTNVASSYFNLRALDAELDVLEATIKTRTDSLQIAQERLDAGVTSELDVVRAKSELASNESDVFSVRRSRAEMENALAILLGRAASDFKAPAKPLASLPPSIPAGAPSELLERRPDVASAERELAAANARIGVATAAFFPVVRLTGAAGFESADLGHLFQWQSSLWQIGPSVTLPIFQGGRNLANLQNAHAAYDEQVARYRQQVLGAFRDVENALVDLRTLAGQADAQERAVEAEKRSLQLSQDQYNKGAANFLDVLDAQRTLLADQRVSVQLLGQRSQATVQLIKALGGNWR
jgi:multidrug efflux system outer membrane protein